MNSGSPSLVAICVVLQLIGFGLIALAFIFGRDRAVVRLRVVAVGVLLLVPNFVRAAIHIDRPDLVTVSVIVTAGDLILLIRPPKLRR